MKLNPYLTFKGNCEEAMNTYKDILGGEFTTVMRFKEAPEGLFPVPDFAKDLIMHCTLEFNGCTLLASDTIDEPGLNIGNNTSMSINAGEEEAHAIFNSLLQGGNMIMPFEDAFWGGKFGM